MKRQLCNHTLSARVRIQKFCAEVLLVLMWGSPAWHMRMETSTAVRAVIIMSHLPLHARRQAEECWVVRDRVDQSLG